MSTDPRRLRCALFVDFDNVYIGLQRLDARAAEAFATAPGVWLAALEHASDDDGDLHRRFLVRSCYLNPSRFSQFRPNFTRAGFSVVDCPSLTQQGKSSADINLVLDAVDALAATTRYDEIVLVSADADFTPLALRARAADRRVTIVTASPAAAAYRAVADQVVTADDLVELLAPAIAAVARQTPEQPGTASGTGSGTAPGSGSGTAPQLAPPVSTPARAPKARRAKEVVASDLPPLQRQVTDVTDVPNLTPERYRVLHTTLADDLGRHAFDRVETARRVYEACQAAGEPIGRSSVTAVESGVVYSGLDPAGRPSAEEVAATWVEYVIGLCRGARMELSPGDVVAIRAWVGGGLVST